MKFWSNAREKKTCGQIVKLDMVRNSNLGVVTVINLVFAFTFVRFPALDRETMGITLPKWILICKIGIQLRASCLKAMITTKRGRVASGDLHSTFSLNRVFEFLFLAVKCVFSSCWALENLGRTIDFAMFSSPPFVCIGLDFSTEMTHVFLVKLKLFPFQMQTFISLHNSDSIMGNR